MIAKICSRQLKQTSFSDDFSCRALRVSNLAMSLKVLIIEGMCLINRSKNNSCIYIYVHNCLKPLSNEQKSNPCSNHEVHMLFENRS